jgi:hypothetical protein
MKTKLFLLTALTIAALDICPFVVAQTDISPTPTQSAQPSPSPRMRGMDEMADMCQEMMKGEKAAMPYIIGVSFLFGLLLFIALVLLIVLEIQWIKYWSRILKRGSIE